MLQDLHRDEDVASDYGRDCKSLLSLSTASLTPKSVGLVTQSLAATPPLIIGCTLDCAEGGDVCVWLY